MFSVSNLVEVGLFQIRSEEKLSQNIINYWVVVPVNRLANNPIGFLLLTMKIDSAFVVFSGLSMITLMVSWYL